MSDDAPLPAVDWSSATTVFEPPGDGEGHWVGAPCLHRHGGTTYLAVRWRTPERRGYAVAIYERTGPDAFDERARLTADELGVVSVERPALLSDPTSGDLKLYVPVDRDANDWRIRKLADVSRPEAFDPATARDVLVPAAGTTDSVTVKDPYVVTLGERYYMFYAGSDGESEQAHLATSTDGERWERASTNPVLGRRGWHDHHTRVSCVFPPADASERLVCYDGSGQDDYGATWNLRTGVAVSPNLERLVDVTPGGPVLSSPAIGRETDLAAYGTCRYVDVLPTDDGVELFAEVARPDGAFSLRRCAVDWPA